MAKKAIFFLVVIFFSNLIGGLYFGLYSTWWFDIIHHFLGGFFVAMLMANYLSDIQPESTLKKYLIVVGATLFVGVIWEFAEYIGSQILTEPLYRNLGIRIYFIGDLDDTINDLLMDILGAFTFLSHSLRRRKSH